jgi:hypothetical protein
MSFGAKPDMVGLFDFDLSGGLVPSPVRSKGIVVKP